MKVGVFLILAFLVAAFSSQVLAVETTAQGLLSPADLESQLEAMGPGAVSSAVMLGFQCVARGERGEHYYGRARFPDEAQRKAMGECYRFSHRCYTEGCHPL